MLTQPQACPALPLLTAALEGPSRWGMSWVVGKVVGQYQQTLPVGSSAVRVYQKEGVGEGACVAITSLPSTTPTLE